MSEVWPLRGSASSDQDVTSGRSFLRNVLRDGWLSALEAPDPQASPLPKVARLTRELTSPLGSVKGTPSGSDTRSE
jgi:hypothetical protein